MIPVPPSGNRAVPYEPHARIPTPPHGAPAVGGQAAGPYASPASPLAEAEEIQAVLRRSPDAFLSELEEELILIGEEMAPADFIRDRIDFLGLDRTGALVLIQFPPPDGRNQLQQALAFCSMVAQWDLRAIRHEITLHSRSQAVAVERRLNEFLRCEPKQVNRRQRVILVAETFEYEVLITARWLHEVHGLDIRCYRAELIEQRGERFIALDKIFPGEAAPAAPGAGGPALHSAPSAAPSSGERRRGDDPSSWANWDAAMARTKNPAAVDFFKQEITAGVECHIEYRGLVYRREGHRAWSIKAGRQRCRVRQHGRFEGDLSFWRRALGGDVEVTPHRGGRSVRFYLSFDEHFERFKQAITHDLASVRLESLRAADGGDGAEDDSDLDETD